MLAVTDPTVRKITVMGPTQLLKTELLNNICGYFIACDPCPMVVMQPTGSLGETWSRDRFDPLVRDTPVLRELVSEKKSRDNGNTLNRKSFPGGQVTIVGSNSPSELASRPIRVVLADEIDKMDANIKGEGDPLKLIAERTATFFNALIVQVCSPTIDGRSRIQAEYEQSDKRVFCVPCPYCDHTDELKWEHVRWEKHDPEGTASYYCPACNRGWSEVDRLKAIAKGSYKATAPFTGHAGFKVNKLASPWESVGVLARKWNEAKGHPEKLKVFVNTQLAETWVEKGEAPEHKRLYERRERYTINTLPQGAILLTAGVDVQKDRLEIEIVGWGRGKESWSIDYRVIPGETSTEAPWKELDKILNEAWLLPSGIPVKLHMMSVDSGYNTQHVYNWARKQSPSRVRVVKGSDSTQMPFGSPKAVDHNKDGQKVKRSVQVWPVGVSVLKSEIYGWLKLDGPGENEPFPQGYCHFPEYSEDYFKQLTAEQLMKKTVNGQVRYHWVKVHERNEALDCRVYARAAAAMFGIDRFKEEDWLTLAGEYILPGPKVEPTAPKPEQRTQPTSTTPNFWRNKPKGFW